MRGLRGCETGASWHRGREGTGLHLPLPHPGHHYGFCPCKSVLRAAPGEGPQRPQPLWSPRGLSPHPQPPASRSGHRQAPSSQAQLHAQAFGLRNEQTRPQHRHKHQHAGSSTFTCQVQVGQRHTGRAGAEPTLTPTPPRGHARPGSAPSAPPGCRSGSLHAGWIWAGSAQPQPHLHTLVSAGAQPPPPPCPTATPSVPNTANRGSPAGRHMSHVPRSGHSPTLPSHLGPWAPPGSATSCGRLLPDGQMDTQTHTEAQGHVRTQTHNDPWTYRHSGTTGHTLPSRGTHSTCTHS